MGRSTHHTLSMKGGRSQGEQGMSRGTMFKAIREKVNTAAKDPSFFDSGLNTADVSLYIKSANDGQQIGDCPFGQFLQMVLLKKGVPYNVFATSADNKPDWLVSKHDGKMPALQFKDETMTDSLAMAEFIEKKFPAVPLTRQGVYSYQEVLEKTSNFFPSVAAFIKNTEDSKDASLAEAVSTELDNLDALLRTTPGHFLCGMELTLADYYITPQLFHAMVACEHFKGMPVYNIGTDPTRPALEAYMGRMFDSREFNNKKAYYSVDQVISGWKAARGGH